MPKQLTFTFPQNDESTFEKFHPGSNQIAFQFMQNLAEQKTIFCTYLWGIPGIGKTHLMQAAYTAQNNKNNQSAAYLPLSDIQNISPTVLQELKSFSLVCLDDVHTICQNGAWEEALFHLYNQLDANHSHLVLSSFTPPNQLNIKLPDLKSRIGASFIMEMKPLSDPEKLVVLKNKAESRKFNLPDNVLEFLINHFPRDMNQLVNILNQLDKASLIEKRAITIPFVKRVLGMD